MMGKLFLFLAGGLLGFLVAVLFQPLLRPLVTDALRGEEDVTEGRVVGKRLQGERLLVTVDAAEGTVLATFNQRVEEIDMLVEEGDLLKLGVARYEPFVEDPAILSVRKQELPAAGAPRAGEAGERLPERPAAGIIPRAGEAPEPGIGAGLEPDPERAPAQPGLGEEPPGGALDAPAPAPPPAADRPEGPPPRRV